MRDHILTNSIKLGDLAAKIGDYKCAVEQYSKAVMRLRKQRTKTAQSVETMHALTASVKAISKQVLKGRSMLHFERWKLTKSSFVKGNQCLKQLYLDKHKRHERTPASKELQALFDSGHSFEEKVRHYAFPNGVNVKETVGNFAYFNSYTAYLLAETDASILYEATIIEDDVLVMCDILVKNADGQIDVYEIKMSTAVNEAIEQDLAIQYYVLRKRFGDRLNSLNLILRREEGTRQPWEIINCTSSAAVESDHVQTLIQKYKQTLKEQEPIVNMSDHCYIPYECGFVDYCKRICRKA